MWIDLLFYFAQNIMLILILTLSTNFLHVSWSLFSLPFLLLSVFTFFYIYTINSMGMLIDYNFNIFNWASLESYFLNFYAFSYFYSFLLITFTSFILTLQYTNKDILSFSLYLLIIILASINLFSTNSIILFFYYYEMLLVPSFIILYRFAKTRKAVEAAYLMFFWTQFGALFLIFSIFYIKLVVRSSLISEIFRFSFSNFDLNILTFTLIVGFGVKLPIWPFYGWLPKAHVEAPTNFSIFLSGVLVKFAFLGLLKFLLMLSLEPTCLLFYPFLVIGLVESSVKIFYQIDLKKIIAFSTIIEMHWLCLTVLTGNSNLFLSGYTMLLAHAILSTNFFLLADLLNKYYKSRLVTEISSLGLLNKNLFILLLLNLLLFLGFPGTLLFISEFLFFTFLFDFSTWLYNVLLIILYLLLPTIFFYKWWGLTNGSSSIFRKKLILSLTTVEFSLIIFNSTLLIILGFNWQIFLF